MRSRIMRALMCTIALAPCTVSLPARAKPQVIFGWSDSQQAKRVADFAALTPDHFDRTSLLKDDDLETTASINTEAGYKFRGGFTDVIRSNTFLRALINKRTGATIYQVYANLDYTLEWRDFESINFETTDGPVAQPLTKIAHNVKCTSGVCLYTEDIGFELPESFLRQLADRAADRPVRPWRFRFKSQKGIDWTDDMAPAEAAGLLLAVQRYRSAQKLP